MFRAIELTKKMKGKERERTDIYLLLILQVEVIIYVNNHG
jgi:hypothetical protein